MIVLSNDWMWTAPEDLAWFSFKTIFFSSSSLFVCDAANWIPDRLLLYYIFSRIFPIVLTTCFIYGFTFYCSTRKKLSFVFHRFHLPIHLRAGCALEWRIRPMVRVSHGIHGSQIYDLALMTPPNRCNTKNHLTNSRMSLLTFSLQPAVRLNNCICFGSQVFSTSSSSLPRRPCHFCTYLYTHCTGIGPFQLHHIGCLRTRFNKKSKVRESWYVYVVSNASNNKWDGTLRSFCVFTHINHIFQASFLLKHIYVRDVQHLNGGLRFITLCYKNLPSAKKRDWENDEMEVDSAPSMDIDCLLFKFILNMFWVFFWRAPVHCCDLRVCCGTTVSLKLYSLSHPSQHKWYESCVLCYVRS